MTFIDRRRALQLAAMTPLTALSLGCAQRASSASPPPTHSAITWAVALGATAGENFGNPTLLGRRNAPCSTFKIPLTLMLLEEGIVRDITQAFEVDRSTYQPEPWWFPGMVDAWNQPHSLKSGYAVSAIWLYRKLAKQLGTSRMAHYVKLFDYGDGNLGYGVDNFWNAGDQGLGISPVEQCRFLDRVARRQFPLRPATYEQAFAVYAGQQREGYKIFSKTGLGWHGKPEASLAMGWAVGWVETQPANARHPGIVPFASYCDDASVQKVLSERRAHANAALQSRGWAF